MNIHKIKLCRSMRFMSHVLRLTPHPTRYKTPRLTPPFKTLIWHNLLRSHHFINFRYAPISSDFMKCYVISSLREQYILIMIVLILLFSPFSRIILFRIDLSIMLQASRTLYPLGTFNRNIYNSYVAFYISPRVWQTNIYLNLFWKIHLCASWYIH